MIKSINIAEFKNSLTQEIRVNNPISLHKVSWNKMKEALIEDMYETVKELDIEDDRVNNENLAEAFSRMITRAENLVDVSEIYVDLGFGKDQILLVLQRLFILK